MNGSLKKSLYFLFLGFVFITSFLQAAGFQFIATADMREFSGSGIYDKSDYFRGACEVAAGLGPHAFVIIPGDLDPPGDVEYTVQTYLGSDFLMYPCAGNHETETPSDMTWLRDYNPGGNTLPYIVNVGPTGCEETTFSFDYENAHFVVLNEYYDGTSDIGTDGDVVDSLYNWLADDLASTSKQHVFVIGHEPAYPQPDIDNGRLRHVGECLDMHPANRDRFWALLQQENVAAYICGHTHNYSLIQFDDVWQMDVGHSRGAGDTGAASTFAVISVNEDTVSYTTYRDTHDGVYDYDDIIHQGYLNITNNDTVVERGSTWNYLDNGSDQGAAWQEISFDDSGWFQGAGELGYGDGGEVTIIDYGSDPNNKYITTYFRHDFTLTNLLEYLYFQINLLCDDGAIMYINGTEAQRFNIPEGSVNYLTVASVAISGDAETTYSSYSIDPQYFSAGINVISVEVHQSSGTSSDVSFDLELIGAKLLAPDPTLQIKIILEGCYDASADTMRTALLQNGQIPLSSPYSEDPQTVDEIPDNTVDWILVQLRETETGPIIVSKSAFLRNDGILMNLDGTEGVQIPVDEGDYYVIVKHRNHLSVMSAGPVTVSSRN